MKIEFSLIGIILILVLSIGAVSAADIDNATDSDSIISVSSPVDLSVENDGSGYVDDDIDTNDSDSSLLGVSGDEDIIGGGEIVGFEFKDAVDGVITFYEAKDWNQNPGNWEDYGYRYNMVYIRAFDESNDTVELDGKNFDFEFDGCSIPDDYKGDSPFSYDKDGYQGSLFTNLPGLCRNDDGDDLDGVIDFQTGTYEFVIYNADRSVSKSVTFKLIEPKKVEATVSISDVITLNITTNDGPGNFTVYFDNESIATGNVDDEGNSSVTFEKKFGSHPLKVVLDGVTVSGLTWEDTIFIPSPGMFSDLSSMIANNDVVNLTYNIILDPYEANLLKDGIIINKNVTINGNGYTINGTDLVRIFYIKDNENANVILRNLTITGGLATSDHGGAIYLRTGSLTIENCTFVANTLKNSEAHGGAIHASERTTLTIKDSVFENNTDVPKDAGRWWRASQQYGGAIYCSDYVNLNVTNTLFKGNKAINNNFEGREARAGAIYSVGSNSNNNIINCTFINNTADNGVGAIQTRIANIIGCIFDDNYADNDWPTIYFEGDGKGTISYNIFFDNTTQIRLRDNYANVAEEYNWYATNEPDKIVRLNDQLSTPNKYLMLDVYNEGTTVKVGLMKDSSMGTIPDINALPLRTIKLTGDVNETEPALIDGVATVTYTSEITSESIISATIDGYTVNYTLALGNITNINVIYVENTTVGENGTVLIYLLGDNGAVDGNLAIYLNDTKFEVAVANGVATLNAGYNFNGGIYDISYIYLGSANYVPSRDKVKSDSKFKVDKKDAEITYRISDDGYITIKVVDNEFKPSGSVRMEIDDVARATYGTSVTTNLPQDLSNGTHKLNLTYSGDAKHNPATLIDSLDLLKYEPTCNITNDNGYFTLNFTDERGVPSGSVEVFFEGPNSFSEYLYQVGDGIKTYDASSRLLNGTYTLTVRFNSYSWNYESKDFIYVFNSTKYTPKIIAPEVVTKPIYTTMPITITVTGEEGDPIPTGRVSYTVQISWFSRTFSADLNENGTDILNWVCDGDQFGSRIINIDYSGDKNYQSTSIPVTFVCEPSLNIKTFYEGNNITFTFQCEPSGQGTIYISENGEILGTASPYDEFGLKNVNGTYHTYDFIWAWDDENNYTFSVDVEIPGTSQWTNLGNDYKNTGSTNATRLDNVFILWNATLINNLRASPVIDSKGNIYFWAGAIYAFTKDGVQKWRVGENTPGIAIFMDQYIINPQTGNALRVYETSTGKQVASNLWHLSSNYAPVVYIDDKVYIASQWEYGGYLGYTEYAEQYDGTMWADAYDMFIDSPLKSSPTFDDNGYVYAVTEKGLIVVNLESRSVVFSNPDMATSGRIVIDESNIAYAFSKDNTIVAFNLEAPLWNVTITNSSGNVLAVDSENAALYTVNANGIVYKIDTETQEVTEIYDINATALSIIIDGEGKVYINDDVGNLYAFDNEGNLLWTINLGSQGSGSLVMAQDGTIYAVVDKTLFAIGYRNELAIEVTVPEGEYTALDNVTITATLNETTEGNVTFTINGKNTTVAINGTVAELTTTIPGGIQTIVATFEGNDAYMPAAGNTTVDIAKLDVEFENIPEEISMEDFAFFNFNIVQNNTIVSVGTNTFKVYKDDEELSNSNYGIYDGFELDLWEISSGNYNMTIAFVGNDVYNPANATFYLSVLPKVSANVVVSDDEMTVDVQVGDSVYPYNPISDATGKFTVIANNETLGEGTIENGVGSVTFDKLEPGTYEFTIVYDGDDNYPANNATVSVKIPRTSQWPSVGGNPQNSGAANATREDGVSIIWEAALNGDLRSSAIIDSFGNVYVNDGSKIYAFTSEGKLIWSGGIGSAGIALYKDELILAPQYHNAMMIYNATTGAAIPGNFWTASSNFAPITGPDGRIYTPTDYGYPANGQGWSGNYWISVFDETGNGWEPYGFNLFLVEVTDVGYGPQAMKASPSFDKLGYIYVNTVKGFKIVNVATGATVFSDTSINGVGRPVIDANNIAYILDSTLNGIYAISTEGIVWNVTVTDGIGSTLAVDNENGFLYAVNANGTLYKYDTTDGSESLVYNLGANGVSIILDADSNVYVSTAAGDVVAISADGDLLWTINLGSKVTGQLAMDNNGIIYAVADKTLYALGFDANMTVAGENVTVFDNEIITVTIAAEGNVTITFNGESTEVPVENGTATLDLGQLPAGTYTVSVTYDGDGVTYGPAFAETTFEIIKADAEITEDIVASVENSTLTLTLPANATGIVLAKVDGKGYYAEVENGTAVIEIPELAPGKYPVDITYLGDDNYNNASITTELEVPELLDAELTADVNDTVITVTINENATGKVIVTVGNNSYVKDASEAPIVIDVADLEAGEYDVTVEYLGDENFNNATATNKVTVPEDPVVEPEDANVTVDVNGSDVNVELPDDATGYVVVSVDGKDYFFNATDDIELDLDDLAPGEYPVVVTYSGDDKYAPAVANSTIVVPEVVPEDANMTADVNGTDVAIDLPDDATGYVVVSVDGKDYFFNVTDDIELDLSDLAPGEYPVEITYSGDDKYAPATANTTVTVPEVPVVEPEDANMTADVNDSEISVELPDDATGYVVVSVDGKDYYFDAADDIELDLSDLAPGEYPVEITYSGDDKYAPATANTTVTVPEVLPEDANITVSVENNTITVTADENATGNVLVDVNGTGYYAPLENGKATIDVIGLDEGTYDATVTYSGDDVYAPDTKNATVTVPKKEEPVTPEPVDPEADISVSNETVSMDLPEDATGYMLVDVDGTGYYVPVKDGKASFDLPELAPGNHTIAVTYTGDKNYAPANATQTITVEKEVPTVVAENLTKVEKAPDRFEANFTDASGNPLANANVTFEINGGKYTRVTDANGKAGMNINLDAGTYTIVTTNPVTGESVTNTIVVLPRLEGSDLTKYFRNASQYRVKVLDDNGNPAKAGEVVSFNINGVFYNRTTDANGFAQLSINLNPGDYIITAEYKNCRISNNIKVLPVLTGKDLTKKFGEAAAFEATLVDGQGKAYANQRVEFNINGVFYYRNTDSNGVAKLNINLQPGEYIITSVYDAAAISNRVTVTA